MSVTARGRAEQQRYFRRIPDELAKVLRGAGRTGGRVVAEEARRRARSEEVRDNVTVTTSATADRIMVRITVKPGWARAVGVWLEYGTDPHFISVDPALSGGRSARRVNKVTREGVTDLKATLVINGRPVGATVFHPGAQPHPFLRPAIDTQRAEAIAAAQAYINRRVTRRGIDATDGGEDA